MYISYGVWYDLFLIKNLKRFVRGGVCREVATGSCTNNYTSAEETERVSCLVERLRGCCDISETGLRYI